MGVKLFSCEFARCEQPPICLFPLPGSGAFLMWFLGIVVIWDQVDQRSFTVSFAPTFHGEFVFCFGLWDYGSLRQLRKNRIHRSDYMLSGALLERCVLLVGADAPGAILCDVAVIPALLCLF